MCLQLHKFCTFVIPQVVPRTTFLAPRASLTFARGRHHSLATFLTQSFTRFTQVKTHLKLLRV